MMKVIVLVVLVGVAMSSAGVIDGAFNTAAGTLDGLLKAATNAVNTAVVTVFGGRKIVIPNIPQFHLVGYFKNVLDVYEVAPGVCSCPNVMRPYPDFRGQSQANQHY